MCARYRRFVTADGDLLPRFLTAEDWYLWETGAMARWKLTHH